MEILYVLLLLLLVTRVFGEVAVRLGQPALVGELISGVVLGLLGHHYGAYLPVLEGLTEDRVFGAITDLAVFFLMLMAGLEMHPHELMKRSGGAIAVAIGGMVVPLAMGMALAWAFLPASELLGGQVLFVGTALAVTAVEVSVRLLLELDRLRTRYGQIIVSAAIVSDVLGLVLLALLTATIGAGGRQTAGDWLLLIGEMALFFVITGVLGMRLLPKLGKALKRFVGPEAEFSALLAVGLGFAVLAEFLEMHFIVGAFVAGLFFGGRELHPDVYKDLQRKVSGITTGFLAPIFFASIGLHLDLAAVTASPWFLLSLIGVALSGKLIGAGLAAYGIGLSRHESLTIGVGMSARATVVLVIAQVAMTAGLFTRPEPTPPIVQAMFSSVVIMALTTTLVVPIVLRRLVVHEADGATERQSDKGKEHEGTEV